MKTHITTPHPDFTFSKREITHIRELKITDKTNSIGKIGISPTNATRSKRTI